MLLNIPLRSSPFNAGETGWATLVGRGDQTDVTITVSGVPPEVTRPVHLYTFIHQGACGALSPQPAYSLTGIVLARSASARPGRTGAPFTVSNTASVPLSTLQSTAHAIIIKSAPADGNRDLFCGDIVAPRPPVGAVTRSWEPKSVLGPDNGQSPHARAAAGNFPHSHGDLPLPRFCIDPSRNEKKISAA
jgi:hypothetical protein